MAALSKLMVELGLDDQLSPGLGEASSNLKKYLAVGAIVAAGAVIGKTLYNIGSMADDMADTITIKTGATGKAFDSLQQSAMNVFKTVPTDAHTAAMAISELYDRTGATGKTLDTLAESEIELARITGTDLNGNIASSTAIFNAWGIATKDQTKTLDYLFNVSQKTGVGIDQLMSEVQQFTPQLKAMNLTVDQGANLIGKIDKAGGHVAIVMRGITKETNALAKAGIPAKKGLTDVYNGIKNAGSAAEANTIAVKAFGSKAGPELAQMIRDGTLSLDDMTGSVQEAGKSILDTAKSTYDFSENWQLFKNGLMAALVPVGSLVFSLGNQLIPLLTAGVDAIAKVGKAFGDAFGTGTKVSDLLKGFPDWAQPAVDVLLKIADAAGDVVRGFSTGGLAGAFDALGPAIRQAVDAIGSFALDVTVNIGHWLIDQTENLYDAVKGKIAEWLGFNGPSELASMSGTPVGSDIPIGTLAVAIGDWAVNALTDLGTAVADKVGALWGAVKSNAIPLGTILVDGAFGLGATLLGIAADFGTWLENQIEGNWDGAIDIASALIDGILDLGSDLLAIAADFGTWLWSELKGNWDNILDLGSVTLNALIAVGGDLLAWSQNLSGSIKTAIGWVGDKTIEVGKLTIVAATEVHDSSGDDTAPGKSFLQKMLDFFSNAPEWYSKIDTAVLGGIAYGIGAAIGTVAGLIFDAVGLVIDAIYTAITDPRSVLRLAEAVGKALAAVFQYGLITVPEAIITQFWSGLADSFALTTPDAFTDPIGQTLSDAFGASKTWATGVAVAVATGIADALQHITLPSGIDFSGVVSGIGSAIGSAFTATADWATGIVGTIATGIQTAADNATGWDTILKTQGGNLIVGLGNGAVDEWNNVVSLTFTNLPQTVFDTIGTVTETLKQKGIDLIAGVQTGWTEQSNKLAVWARDFGTWIFGEFPDLSGTLKSIGSDLISGIESGWTTESNKLAGWATNFGTWILGQFPDMSGALYSIGTDLVSGIVSGITDAGGDILSAILGAIPDSITISIAGHGVSIPISGGALGGVITDAGTFARYANGGLIPGYANGGRIVMVGERGPELAALPVGTRVFSHGDTMNMLRNAQGGGDTYNQTFNFTVTGNDDPKATANEVFALFTREMQLRSAS